MSRSKKTKQPDEAPQADAQPAPKAETRGKQHVEWSEAASVPFEAAQANANAAFARYEQENGVKLAPPSMRLCEMDGKRVWHFFTETV